MSERIRKILNAFYATIKNKMEKIRFFFITGVVKLANLSIFSAMNNLKDISMDPDFAGAFGFTEKEIKEYYGRGIDEYLAANSGSYKSREELLERMRTYYDGYRFSPYSDISVYNPISIGNFFENDCRFDTYWDETGSSKFAVTLATKMNLSSLMNSEISLNLAEFRNFDISEIAGDNMSPESIAALLYYAGYLTIVSSRNEDSVKLGFPNNEVSSAFTYSLIRRFRKGMGNEGILIADAAAAVKEGDTPLLINLLNDFYDQASSAIISKRLEQPYQLIMHMFFIAAGCRATAEISTKLGRIDNSIEAGKHIYIFELKVDQSAETALNQIREKEYSKLFTPRLKQGDICSIMSG